MHTYKCTILRVVDGDTVDVDIDLGFGVWMRKERVRLLGIDTPESRTSDKVEKVYGNLAKDFVKSYLPVGSSQTLQTEKDKTGKFGRILGRFLVYDNVTDAHIHLGGYHDKRTPCSRISWTIQRGYRGTASQE